ncbi:hypothetical protein ACVMB0_006942 [Bradyrhizobium sp. USDA 4451]
MSFSTWLISSRARGGGDREQAGAHGILGTLQQVAQQLGRNVDAQPEDLDQFVVAFGARDDAGITVLGELGAGILGEAADHLVLAAIYDHVGDRSGQVFPRRDRVQMVLALAAGDLAQRGVGEAAGVGQDLACDADVVVPGQMLNHLKRRIVERREPLAELGARTRLDARDQEAQHVVEHLDLFIVEAVAVVQEQIGDLPQRLHALGRRPVPDRILEFGNNRL